MTSHTATSLARFLLIRPYLLYSTVTTAVESLTVLFPSLGFVTSSRLEGARRGERGNRMRAGGSGLCRRSEVLLVKNVFSNELDSEVAPFDLDAWPC